MKALILVAGFGSRLSSAVEGMPKSLIPIGGKPLLDRQIELLEQHNVERICLATGYQHDIFYKRYGDRVDYRFNPNFGHSNNIISFIFARDWIDDDLIVLYGDLLYEPGILQAALASPADIGLVVDRNAVEQGHALVSVKDCRITSIDTKLDVLQAHSRFIGIAKFTKKGLSDMLPEVEAAVRAGMINDYYIYAARALMGRQYPIVPIDVTGQKWMEIDFPQDLERAKNAWC